MDQILQLLQLVVSSSTVRNSKNLNELLCNDILGDGEQWRLDLLSFRVVKRWYSIFRFRFRVSFVFCKLLDPQTIYLKLRYIWIQVCSKRRAVSACPCLDAMCNGVIWCVRLSVFLVSRNEIPADPLIRCPIDVRLVVNEQSDRRSVTFLGGNKDVGGAVLFRPVHVRSVGWRDRTNA